KSRPRSLLTRSAGMAQPGTLRPFGPLRLDELARLRRQALPEVHPHNTLSAGMAQPGKAAGC
ncbi:MAG: hypothetical protein ACUVV6_05840, partial [Thermoplasmatota archaeon]